ncbi:uncharacterized protein [Solanum lycopersicum]|uniref:uncharacterized protein n=1 Tax=Solanum lycopersicum TaxID=4081 RepID=UPI003748A71C
MHILWIDAESEDSYDFLVECHELPHKMGIVERFGAVFVTYQFQGNAKMRWRSHVECQPTEAPPMTWVSFSNLFMEKYIPRTLRDRKRDEFLSLEQGRMSVMACEAMFHALSRHATQLCFSPQERIRRFMKGLRSELRTPALQIKAMAKSFQEMVDFVIEVKGVKTDDFTMTSTSKMFRKRDLVILEMVDFDVILGMTWLSRNFVTLDCNAKTVTLAKPGTDPLVWEGDYTSNPVRIVSFLRTKKMRRCMELQKDDDITILYHSGKANVVADTLSRKARSMGSLAHLQVSRRPLAREVQTLANDLIRFEVNEKGGLLACVEARSSFLDKIKGKQFDDEKLSKIQDKVLRGEAKEAQIDEEGVLRIKGRQVKYEHQRPGGTLQRVSIPELKWERIVMNFVVGLPKTMEKLAKIYISEIVLLHGVPLSIISDRGTQFTSKFWKTLHVELGARLDLSTVFHPQTDVQSERTIQVLEDRLRAYHGDGNYIIRCDSVLLDENLSYEEEPVSIIDREVRKLRSREIASIKVL